MPPQTTGRDVYWTWWPFKVHSKPNHFKILWLLPCAQVPALCQQPPAPPRRHTIPHFPRTRERAQGDTGALCTVFSLRHSAEEGSAPWSFTLCALVEQHSAESKPKSYSGRCSPCPCLSWTRTLSSWASSSCGCLFTASSLLCTTLHFKYTHMHHTVVSLKQKGVYFRGASACM